MAKKKARYAYDDSLGKDLVIIAGSNPEDTSTAEDTVDCLLNDFGLENITLVTPQETPDKKKVPKEARLLNYGEFTGGESMFEGGRRTVKDLFDNKHIVFIKHLYTPLATNKDGDSVKINDNKHEMRMLGSIIERARLRGDCQPAKFTLAAPYLVYVRSHSIEKLEEEGLYQGDSLGMFVRDCAGARLDEVTGIDPHSSKIWSLLSDQKIYAQNIDPFQSPQSKDWRMILPLLDGMSKEDRIKALTSQCPFYEWYLQTRNDAVKLSYVQVDKGAYKRTKEFGLNTDVGLENVLALIKIRDGEGNNRISGVERYSQLHIPDIKGRDFVIPDDLVGTGGTTDDTARFLKEDGARKVYAWVTHNAGRKLGRLKNSKYIDQIVMLDTVRNEQSDKFTYLKKSGVLLGGAIYKSHMNWHFGMNK